MPSACDPKSILRSTARGLTSSSGRRYVREVAAAFVHDMEERIQVGLNKRRYLSPY